MEHPFITPWRPEGLFDDPVRDFEFGERMATLLREIEDNFGRVSAAPNISIALPASQTGQADAAVSLQTLLAPLDDDRSMELIPAGTIVGYYGSYANARRLASWQVCDGDGGAPNLLGRGLRWADSDQDAGTEGGSATHSHDSHLSNEVAAMLEEHSQHVHIVSGYTDYNCCYVKATCCASGVEVARGSHRHGVSITSNYNAQATKVTQHTGAEDGELEHSAESNWSPYTRLIPIMKL